MSQSHDPVKINRLRSLQRADLSGSRATSPLRQALWISSKNTHSKCGDSLNVCGLELTYGMHSSTGFSPSAGGDSQSCIGPRSMWPAAPLSFWSPAPKPGCWMWGQAQANFAWLARLATLGHFTGVEQRPHLAELSRSFARKYAIPRVHFLHANAGDLDWSRYNAFYFYNPFYENLDPDKKIDERVELSPSLYNKYMRMAQDRLAEAPSGTRVVTFHGMGGEMPNGYERVLQEFQDTGFLELWIRNPSPEVLISLQKISPRPEDLQAPCCSPPDGAGAENRLWVSFCDSTRGTAPASEDSVLCSTSQNPCLELPISCSRF